MIKRTDDTEDRSAIVPVAPTKRHNDPDPEKKTTPPVSAAVQDVLLVSVPILELADFCYSPGTGFLHLTQLHLNSFMVRKATILECEVATGTYAVMLDNGNLLRGCQEHELRSIEQWLAPSGNKGFLQVAKDKDDLSYSAIARRTLMVAWLRKNKTVEAAEPVVGQAQAAGAATHATTTAADATTTAAAVAPTMTTVAAERAVTSVPVTEKPISPPEAEQHVFSIGEFVWLSVKGRPNHKVSHYLGVIQHPSPSGRKNMWRVHFTDKDRQCISELNLIPLHSLPRDATVSVFDHATWTTLNGVVNQCS